MEKLSQLNAGFDAVFVEHRWIFHWITSKETKDALAPMQILMVTRKQRGQTPAFVNAVTLQNTGLELSATWRIG